MRTMISTIATLAAFCAVIHCQDDVDFKDLTTQNNLALSESFRCGVFFAGAKGKAPAMEVFVIPKTWKEDCSNPDTEKIKKHCLDLFTKLKGKVTWKSESRERGAGFTVGDDLCKLLKEKGSQLNLKPARYVRGKFPIGFYYNYCGQSTWYDTGLRADEPLCCQKNRKHRDC